MGNLLHCYSLSIWKICREWNFFNGHTTAGGLGLALRQWGVAEQWAQASRLQQIQASSKSRLIMQQSIACDLQQLDPHTVHDLCNRPHVHRPFVSARISPCRGEHVMRARFSPRKALTLIRMNRVESIWSHLSGRGWRGAGLWAGTLVSSPFCSRGRVCRVGEHGGDCCGRCTRLSFSSRPGPPPFPPPPSYSPPQLVLSLFILDPYISSDISKSQP